jgi:transposase
MKAAARRARDVGPPPKNQGSDTSDSRKEAQVQYLGIDWGTRKAAWCAVGERGEMVEGVITADEDGLAKLVHELGPDVRGCVEMMSGGVWVRDRLAACGWVIQIAEPRKVKALAPLACKTDRVDARVLAELVRRDLVPDVWVPALSERELRERLRRRAHLVRLRTSATNRAFGLLTQWGLRVSLTTLRKPGAVEQLRERGVPPVWLESIKTLLSVIDDLDRQIAPIERELRPLAHDNQQVRLLMTIPGVAELLGLTLFAEIADISRFPTARRLVGYSGLAPTIKQSGQSSRTGPISKAGPSTLRWAAIEAAQGAWRPTNPWHRLYSETKQRHGKSNPAKAAVARKVLIACWHVLARNEPFKRSASSAATDVPASSSIRLAV